MLVRIGDTRRRGTMSTEVRQATWWGTVWHADTGKLVDWAPSRVTVTVPWPRPQAWWRFSTPGAPWRHTFGDVPRWAWHPRVGRSTPKPRELAVRAAWDSVPVPVRIAVEACAFEGHDWRALSLFARCPGALELAESVPLLAGALSVSSILRTSPVQRPFRSARALLRAPDGMKRWRAIAAWLGFDGSASFVQVLRRLVIAAAPTPDDVVALRRVWAAPLGRQRLRHAGHTDFAMIRAMAVAIDLGEFTRLPARLFDAAFAQGSWNRVGSDLDTVIRGWRIVHPGRAIPGWGSPDELEAEKEGLRRLVRLGLVEEGSGQLCELGPFPPPPLPGTPNIVPLLSSGALEAEGQAMQHCLGDANWQRSARALTGFAYTVVVGEERGTLWITRSLAEPGRFVASELRAPRNAPPSRCLTEAVARWLVEHAAGGDDVSRLPEPWNRPMRNDVPSQLPMELRPFAQDDIPF